MSNRKTIVLAAGGTGGHFFPAITLAEELAKSRHDIHLITDRRCEKYITENMPVIPHITDLHIKMSGIFNKAKSIYQLIAAFTKTITLFLKLKPSVVIGFGGYPGFPTMLAASFLKVPIIIQEQNCFFGKSNRIFAKQAKIIALSYKKTNNIPLACKDKIIHTGDIIRETIKKLPEKQSFNAKVFNIFIVGGSQGALIFSKLIPETIQVLKKLGPEIKIRVTQQVADEHKLQTLQSYDKLEVECELQSFFYNIHDIYYNSDLVIARSGASTIAELTTIGLPAIFIPFPYSAEDHQTFNAMALVNDNASWCYNQKDITSRILARKLYELITNRNLIQQASQNLLKRKTNGTKYLADTVLKIIE